MEPLDIISTRRKQIPIDDPIDVVSEAITYFTDGPSHVRLYLGEGVFFESTLPVARFGDIVEFDAAYREEYEIEVGYHKDFHPTINRFHRVLIQCGKMEGVPYDLPELVFTQLMQTLGITVPDFFRSLYVCSSCINQIFTQIGYPFGQGLLSPAEIVNSKFYQRRYIL